MTTTTIHRSTNRTVKAIAAGLAITIGSFAFASSASAGTGQATAPATAEQNARLERACLRIPNLTIRTQNAIERINGGADTRGSLLWLDAAIARANEQDRTDLAEVLTNRRAVRAATVPVLEERLVNLASLAERCSEAGFGQ